MRASAATLSGMRWLLFIIDGGYSFNIVTPDFAEMLDLD